jgi:(4S)-4-hydroxy-5-phosphonooxypentane-2,3-dione isomerase
VFKEATLRNASASVEEPGIARFDVLQDKEYPGRFVLVEVYREEAATKAHKATQHYKTWRETVESMMVEPRTKKIYENVYPGEEGLD